MQYIGCSFRTEQLEYDFDCSSLAMAKWIYNAVLQSLNVSASWELPCLVTNYPPSAVSTIPDNLQRKAGRQEAMTIFMLLLNPLLCRIFHVHQPQNSPTQCLPPPYLCSSKVAETHVKISCRSWQI